MATHMERLGITPHVIEACLGHALKGIAGTYRRYNFMPENPLPSISTSFELRGSCSSYVASGCCPDRSKVSVGPSASDPARSASSPSVTGGVK